MINPVKLLIALLGLGVLSWGIIDGGYFAGKAVGVIIILLAATAWSTVVKFRKKRKQGYTNMKSISFAIRKVILEWLK